MRKKSAKKVENEWDVHWKSEEKKGTREGIATFVREDIFAPTVDHFIQEYFSPSGICVEAGCGSAETSIKIEKKRRVLIALDISSEALKRARRIKVFDKYIKADIMKMPFKEDSVSGIWNLGVMEHFHEPEIQKILKEFHRVLKPGGRVILFWPADYSSSQLS